jgi:multisubunit Na+/H+ antiporter MnhG subunit
VLIVVLLALTTPVAAHAIAQAAYHRREPMRAAGAIDESGRCPGATTSPPPSGSPRA